MNALVFLIRCWFKYQLGHDVFAYQKVYIDKKIVCLREKRHKATIYYSCTQWIGLKGHDIYMV